jgi:hypothetical protein
MQEILLKKEQHANARETEGKRDILLGSQSQGLDL